jgi:hypothetical protein
MELLGAVLATIAIYRAGESRALVQARRVLTCLHVTTGPSPLNTL